MTTVFEVFGDAGVRRVTLYVDWQYRGGPQARVSGPGQTSRRVAVATHAATTTVRLALNRFTRRPIFKWRAWTVAVGGNSEIADTVPSRAGSYGFFPKFPS